MSCTVKLNHFDVCLGKKFLLCLPKQRKLSTHDWDCCFLQSLKPMTVYDTKCFHKELETRNYENNGVQLIIALNTCFCFNKKFLPLRWVISGSIARSSAVELLPKIVAAWYQFSDWIVEISRRHAVFAAPKISENAENLLEKIEHLHSFSFRYHRLKNTTDKEDSLFWTKIAWIKKQFNERSYEASLKS